MSAQLPEPNHSDLCSETGQHVVISLGSVSVSARSSLSIHSQGCREVPVLAVCYSVCLSSGHSDGASMHLLIRKAR